MIHLGSSLSSVKCFHLSSPKVESNTFSGTNDKCLIEAGENWHQLLSPLFSEHLKESLYDEKYSLLKSQRSISSPSREVKVNSKICRTESYLSPVYKVIIQAIDLLLSLSKDWKLHIKKITGIYYYFWICGLWNLTNIIVFTQVSQGHSWWGKVFVSLLHKLK